MFTSLYSLCIYVVVEKEYNIDIERLTAMLMERGWPPPDASRSAPKGYWFQLHQLCRTATSHVLSMF